jgi:hypothetical protein
LKLLHEAQYGMGQRGWGKVFWNFWFGIERNRNYFWRGVDRGSFSETGRRFRKSDRKGFALGPG